jgi:hypothetical protein
MPQRKSEELYGTVQAAQASLNTQQLQMQFDQNLTSPELMSTIIISRQKNG